MILIRIVIDFTSSQLKVHVHFAVSPLESSFKIMNRSLAGLGWGTEEGGEGQVGDEQEEVEGYLFVVLVVLGATRKGLAGVSRNSGKVRAAGGGGAAS